MLRLFMHTFNTLVVLGIWFRIAIDPLPGAGVTLEDVAYATLWAAANLYVLVRMLGTKEK